MKKLLLSTVICSILLWSCEKHPGKPSAGYQVVHNDTAVAWMAHLLDPGVVTNVKDIVQGTPITRQDFLWAMKDKKTVRVFFLMAAYLKPPGKYPTTMLMQVKNINGKDTTKVYYDLRMPNYMMSQGLGRICPEPTPCDPDY